MYNLRILRPIGVALLALVCFVAAQGTGIRLFLHLSYLLLALLGLSYLWAWLNLRGMDVERKVSTHRAQVGDKAQEQVTIENLWFLPKLWVELIDHSDMPNHSAGVVFYLGAHQKYYWVAQTICTMRGKFRLGPVSVASGDPFGIFYLERRLSGENEILVYPRTTPLPGFVLPSAELPGGQDVKKRAFHVTPNVSTIRGYQPGDSFNRIHWRSTARLGDLMVKEFELDPSAEVYVVLDMQERVQQTLLPARMHYDESFYGEQRLSESTEEYAVQAAASIARHLLDQNRMVGLVAWGQQREVVPPEREARQLFKLLESLAILRAHGTQTLAEVLAAEGMRFGRNSTLVIITPSLDERWVASVQHLMYRGVQAVVVLIDPMSFGGWNDSSTILARLAELRIPVYRYSQGQTLTAALQEPISIELAA
jgi:uncharacterized protein (DUF58 family)